MRQVQGRGRRGAALCVLGLAFAVGGCDDERDATALDATADTAADAAPDVAAAAPADAGPEAEARPCAVDVAPPEPPRDLPCPVGACDAPFPDLGASACPPGWRPERYDGVAGHVCWPTPLAMECDRPAAAGGCAAACDEPAPDSALHVAADGEGGDGSPARPLTDLPAALAGAVPGDIIYLGPGRYAGALEVPRGVTLRGACVDDVELVAPPGAEGVRLQPGASLAQVTVLGGTAGVRTTGGDDAPVLLDAVVVRDARQALALAGEVEAVRVVIERAQTGVRLEGGGARFDDLVIDGAETGVVATGARLHLRGASLANLGSGLLVGAGTHLTLDRVSVRGAGLGLQAFDARTVVSADRVAFEGIAGQAFVIGRDAVLGGRDLALREVGTGRNLGRALVAQSRGVIEAQRVALLGLRGDGAVAVDAGSRISLDAVLVRGVAQWTGDEGPGQGDAVVAYLGGLVEVARGRLDGYGQIGAHAAYDGSLAVSDSIIGPAAVDATNGAGILTEPGHHLQVDRTVIRGAAFAALLVAGTPDAEVNDLRIEDTRPRPTTGVLGAGVALHNGANMRLARAEVIRARRFGVYVGEATLDASDLAVLETQEGSAPYSTTPDEDGGAVGVTVLAGQATLTRALVRDSHAAGVQVASLRAPIALLTARDLRVTGTRPGRCEAVICDDEAGHGLILHDGAQATLERVALDDNSGVGAWRECLATMTLTDAAITRSTVGAAAPGACDAADGLTAVCFDSNTVDVASQAVTAPALSGDLFE